MYDTSKVWAGVLKGLRENNEIVLLGICADLKDIEFSNNYITITVNDQARYGMLSKHKDILNKYANGDDVIQIHMNTKKKEKNETIYKLKELFGENLQIVDK